MSSADKRAAYTFAPPGSVDLVAPAAPPVTASPPARTGLQVAQHIVRHALMSKTRIDTRRGGFITPVGTIAGLHRVMDQSFPSDRRTVWIAHSHARAPSHLIGTSVHAHLAAWVNNQVAIPARIRMAVRVADFIKAQGWIPVRAEVPVYAAGFAATALDIVCYSAATQQAVIIELKTTTKNEKHHLATYTKSPKQNLLTHTRVINSEYCKHQLQLAAGMYMIHSTMRVPAGCLRGFVVLVTLDGAVFSYELGPTLSRDLHRVRHLLRARPAAPTTTEAARAPVEDLVGLPGSIRNLPKVNSSNPRKQHTAARNKPAVSKRKAKPSPDVSADTLAKKAIRRKPGRKAPKHAGPTTPLVDPGTA